MKQTQFTTAADIKAARAMRRANVALFLAAVGCIVPTAILLLHVSV